MIPSILHQTWKNTDIPDASKSLVISWKRYNNNFEYRFYDDAALDRIIKEYFPQFLKDYNQFVHKIERIDFARYAIMYLYGGIYADIDMECLRDFSPFLKFDKPIVGREPIENIEKAYGGRDYLLCNAILLSPKDNKFWIELMEYIVKTYDRGSNPVDNTGPMAMTMFLEIEPKYFSRIIILDPCVFYPITNDKKLSRDCNMKESFAVHRWHGTWFDQYENPKIYYIKLGITIIVLFILFYFILFKN